MSQLQLFVHDYWNTWILEPVRRWCHEGKGERKNSDIEETHTSLPVDQVNLRSDRCAAFTERLNVSKDSDIDNTTVEETVQEIKVSALKRDKERTWRRKKDV